MSGVRCYNISNVKQAGKITLRLLFSKQISGDKLMAKDNKNSVGKELSDK